MSEFCVTAAGEASLPFIDSLQRKNAEALSFYPKQVFEREAAAGRLILGMLNGEPAGYIWRGSLGRDVACHQVCIQYDARRRLYGAALIQHVEAEAERVHCQSITLRCGFDLEANGFWKEMGYTCIGHKQGGVRRMRTINVWRKYLQPVLIAPPELVAAAGERDASAWTKAGVRGGSRFARRRQLAAYREFVAAG